MMHWATKKPIEATVQALIIRALNEDGTPMFKSVHKTELMNHSDVDVLIRVVGEINNFQAVDQDIAEKNWGLIQSCISGSNSEKFSINR